MSLILSGSDGLSDVDGSAATPAIRGTDSNTGIFFPAADTIAFAEGGVESMRLDSSGNVGIGTTSPSSYGLEVKKASGTAGMLVASGSNTGSFAISGTDLYVTNSAAGTAQFWTNGSERMRITSGGNLLVGTTASSGRLTCVTSAVQISGYFQSNTTTAGYHGVYGESQKSYGVYGRTYDNAYGGVLGFDSANTTFGILGYAGYGLYSNASINVNGTIYASDGRLKENVKPITNALDKITKLNPVSFDWKAASSKGVANKNAPFPDYGMIAQEVEQILPDIVYETKVPARPKETEGLKTLEDDLGSYKGVDYSRLIPFLTKAIQELKAELDEAKARIAVLEVK